MSNMTFKEKFVFIFLQIITLCLIWIYWNKKKKNISKENELSYSKKTNFDINEFIKLIGNKENIKTCSFTHTKVKVSYNDRKLIEIEKIQKLKGISGLFINDNFLTIIVGNEAKIIAENINKIIN